ncbi:MAG: ATP-binding cassette domain-containing protein [Firmicutes bacterium]|nr:ATP-binding cassette domain-containing protein [Bacillota bacterium]MDD4263278.1 ATP-binding cassette domain-containing protein [Bacillota bacterium]MDD4693159.1 ATP-binding cassette domain-containing protein [Bacillota bacterium]
MLELHDIVLERNNVRSLSDVNLTVNYGETVVLTGPSGCGKSTLIRVALGLIKPKSGEVWFEGVNLQALSSEALRKKRRKMGIVFQEFQLLEHFTVLENVLLPLWEGDRIRNKAEDAIKSVGLWDKRFRYPRQLSGGEKQRVGIARALALDPDIIFWDEPTAALDPMYVHEILRIMDSLAQKKTMLVVTHEMPFALKVADRLVLMEAGKIVEEASPSKIFSEPSSHVGAMYRERLLDTREALQKLDTKQVV